MYFFGLEHFNAASNNISYYFPRQRFSNNLVAPLIRDESGAQFRMKKISRAAAVYGLSSKEALIEFLYRYRYERCVYVCFSGDSFFL